MKKVALIYTGYLRTWDLCCANHKDTFGVRGQPVDGRNFYIYFYTYERPAWSAFLSESKEFNFTQIPDVFHPDPFFDHRYSIRKVPENTVNQTLNQWLNNFVGFRLVPKGYDVYVRVRPDIKFNGPLNFDDFDCTGNNIYIPQGFDYGGVCDQFAFGGYEVMKKFYSIYENCHYLWADGVTWHSEGMQLSNLQREKVDIVRIGSPQIDILR